MQKRKQNNSLPLFQQLADVEQLRGFKTQDERAFEQEQKRRSKRKHIPLAKAPATGPACLRCAKWRTPHDDDEYGTCQLLVVVTDDAAWANVKKGQVVERDVARKELRIGYDHLRTGEAASCSGFTMAIEEAA